MARKSRGVDDPENPEWSAADFRRARPSREVVPNIVEAYLRRRGRPPEGEAPKVQVTLRLDPDVIAYYKRGGEGWQTRINAALARSMKAGKTSAKRAAQRRSA
jgi:uncharacterized protein (DUF4415 family)